MSTVTLQLIAIHTIITYIIVYIIIMYNVMMIDIQNMYMPMHMHHQTPPAAGAWPERPTVLTFDSAAVRNTQMPILSSHFILKRSFYQDRLGTNIGKALNQKESISHCRTLRVWTSTHRMQWLTREARRCWPSRHPSSTHPPLERTMRFLLIGQNRPIFIGNSGAFWICFDRIIGNA
eukprot:COSAG06_NODE_784_length_12328_cov_4.921416_9_plen_177_part_00